jgi:hypothetical protein
MALRLSGLLILIGTGAVAQSVIAPAFVDTARAKLDGGGAAKDLRCDFTSVRPELTYGLWFHAGYRVEIPINQFSGGAFGVKVVVRVTPQGGRPTYLTTSVQKTVPSTVVAAQLSGGFMIGEGSYRVEVLVEDDAQRTCIDRRQIQVKRRGVERELKAVPAPGQVGVKLTDEAVSTDEGWSMPTIFINAAPLLPDRCALSEDDVRMLAESTAALLRHVSPGRARVMVFNVNQGKVFFEQDDFQVSDLAKLVEVLKNVQLAAVDYRTLQNANFSSEFLVKLLGEFRNMESSDVLFWVGPYAPGRTGLKVEGLQRIAAAGIFYLEFRRAFEIQPPSAGGDAQPSATDAAVQDADNVEELVHRIQGETLIVRTPHDLAKAIRRIELRLKSNNVMSN